MAKYEFGILETDPKPGGSYDMYYRDRQNFRLIYDFSQFISITDKV